jgi:hypothetical protein
MYECDKCYKVFEHNYLLEKHRKRKKSCDVLEIVIKNLSCKIEKIDCDINNLEELSHSSKTLCHYCNLIFTLKQNLIRHTNNNCKIKKQLLESKNNYNKILIIKEEELNKKK